jgi:hypothetical protein
MGPPEIVFHQPLREVPVEEHGIGGHVAEGEELVLEHAVEPLVDAVVFGRLGPRPVMLEAKRLAGRIEISVELAAVVGLRRFLGRMEIRQKP